MASSEASGRRRSLLAGGLLLAMWAALVASYGTFASYAVRFLFPARRRDPSWTYVLDAKSLPVGQALQYITPDGAKITLARQGSGQAAEDFVALSSVCPHLGCQVSWEGQNNRFFCPCHNGVFAPDGTGVSGPPGDAGQSLPKYSVKIQNGLVYLDVPQADGLAQVELRQIDESERIVGPGHDPCLMADLDRDQDRRFS